MFKYFLYRLRWWLADHTPYLPKAPINLDLELAGKCNLSCTMCPYGTGAFDESMQGMMDKEMALKALREGAAMGIKSVKFNFRGEPGLHKDLSELMIRAKALGYVDRFINTNLTAFSEERINALIKARPTKIIVSIDGITPEEYEETRKGAKWSKLVRNFHFLREARYVYSPETKIIIQSVGTEKPDLTYLNADEYRFQPVQDRGQGDQRRTGERRRCPQPRQRLVIGWDGTIFPCCSNWNNEYPLGNYNTMSLKQAWNGYRMTKLREDTQCQNFPCKDCQVGGSWK